MSANIRVTSSDAEDAALWLTERLGDALTDRVVLGTDADGYGVFRFDSGANEYVPVDAAVDGLTCTVPDAPQDAQYVVRACRVIDGDVSWSADSPAAAA